MPFIQSKCPPHLLKQAGGLAELGKEFDVSDATGKPCFRCGAAERVPNKSYCRDCKRADGRAYYAANREQQKEYRAANREQILKRQKEWYAANHQRLKEYRAANRERIAKRKKEYNAANREQVAEYKRQYRAANRERVSEYRRQYRAANRERVAEYNKQYNAANRERVAEQKKDWYATNRESQLARLKTYRAANPHVFRNNEAKRRARKGSAPIVPFTQAQWLAKVAYWGNRCWLCGDDWSQMDHVKPLAAGGAHMLCNLRPICPTCNQSKHARWPLPPITIEGVAM